MRPSGRTLLQRIFLGSLAASLAPLILAGAFFLLSLSNILTESDTEELITYASHEAYLIQDQEWHAGMLPSPPAGRLGPETMLVDLQGLGRLTARYGAVDTGPRVPPAAMAAVLAGQTASFPLVRPLARSGTLVVVPILRGDSVAGAVVSWMPVGEQAQTNRTLARVLTFTGLLCLAVAGLLAWRLSRSVALPLSHLGQLATRIASGDFTQRVAPGSPPEVAELGRAFNHMAEELDRLERMRRDLVANVSHELKSPLARIAGYVAAVQDGIGGEQARAGYLQIVQQETLRLSRLVDDLLDFARLEAGRLPLHPVACELLPVLERTVAAFRPQARGAGIRLDGPGMPRLPLVDCDPERVVQVLGNLLTNALAVTPTGGRVAVAATPAAGSVEIAVIDSGPGVPPEEQEAVFERFYKIDKVRTPAAEAGHGLGLAIVKQLVELHGGTVGVISDGRTGSRFWIRLPTARPPQ